MGYECIETNLTRYDIVAADEVFVTASLEAIAAVGSIDGKPLPAPIPGPHTAAIRAAYVKTAIETGTLIHGQAARPIRDQPRDRVREARG